jgi:hypothetical protein
VRNGVPFNSAMGLDKDEHYQLSDIDIAACAILFSEFEGNEFDLNAMRFKDPK